MNFYRITARKTKNEIKDLHAFAEEYRKKSDMIYEASDKNYAAIICNISEYVCTIAVAVKPDYISRYSADKVLDDINSCFRLSLHLKNSNEISLASFRHILRTAERNDFLEDRDEIIDELKLECDCRYNEFIASDRTKKEMTDIAKAALYEKTFVPELNRIYKSKAEGNQVFFPVHYIIRHDASTDYKALVDSLIFSLYKNKRVNSKRFSEFSVNEDIYSYISDLRQLYTLHTGGTVILKIEPEENGYDNEFGNNDVCTHIERISKKILSQFSDKVLTIFLLPVHATKECEAIYKNNTTPFVEIYPENASGERARRFLRYKAKKAEVVPDEKLFSSISDDKAFCCYELCEQFSEWYSQHLLNTVFPQYSNVERKTLVAEQEYFGRALGELDSMIGLKSAKDVIYHALDYYKVQKMYKKFGKKTQSASMHLVFTGNPGTAKTTVARLFAQILKDNDVITNGRLVEVGRADLIGKYVGHTAPLVKKAFDAAQGGVLFIDEAYSLLDDKEGLYGDEAINTIVQEMENRRSDTIVIFAGYPREMEKFLNRNPGLRSRIAFHVGFDDYTPDELFEISKLMAKQKDNVISDDCEEKLTDIFRTAASGQDFGNGRFVRNLMESAEMKRASRIARLDNEAVTKELLDVFEPEDFEYTIKETPKKSIGFAV